MDMVVSQSYTAFKDASEKRLGGREAGKLESLEAWRLGGLEAWRPGGLEAWRLGGLEAWMPGSSKAAGCNCFLLNPDCASQPPGFPAFQLSILIA
jgi:hypothetical protein